ncbi:unnamed protein product [Rotaria sordida]|uniref:SecA family profile domain-containing protein n=1 Tax=Rotaria sordida TaxID=392033 RepID=A0A815SBB8_9BILA|nr:unnamed protein product [Rotaria sordida]CAF1485894.1 unnamed protein product [Rotaria sordida]
MENKNSIGVIQKTTHIRPKVLLIDEVDVFLSEKFYGGMYTSSVFLKDPTTKSLLDTIWNSKPICRLSDVKDTPAYNACANRFSNWTFLLDGAVKNMIAALKSYQSSTYSVENDRIVYVEGESLATNVFRGYDTVWAYYHEKEKGSISENSLETNVGIIISCGTFSYVHIPKDFCYITGVSGTLRTLADAEKKILQNVYGIAKNIFMPSVFRFYNSDTLSSIKGSVQLITERVSAKERETFIKRAATYGKVTLLTRTFGRGTDFICRNRQVLANGGIHVLQTFFSKELSEEYQIMGRGARQGDRDSYRMILLENDLEWILGAQWENEVKKIKGSILYETLDKERSKLYENSSAGRELGITQCTSDHNSSKNFLDALIAGDIDRVKKFLLEQNRGPNIDSPVSRTVLLMDATGSMSNLLSATKETICTMFERASVVLGE